MPVDAATLTGRPQKLLVKKQAIGRGLLRASGRPDRALAANRRKLAMKQQIAEKKPKSIQGRFACSELTDPTA
jgi:hypothetical protein